MKNVLENRRLVHLGTISYGVYMIHTAVWWVIMQVLRFGLNAPTAPDAFGREIAVIGNPVLAVVMAFIGVLITLVLAHLSYRYFETRIMRADKRRVVRQAPKAEPAAAGA